MSRPRLVKVVTPPGVASFPHLTAPDDYKGKKEFKTALILDPANDGVKEFLAKVEEASQKAYEDGKAAMSEELESAKGKKLKELKDSLESLQVHLPYEPEYNDAGDETGRIVVKAKALAGGVYQHGPKEGQSWSRELPIFDAAKNKLNPDDIRLWGGSVIRIQCEMNPYCMRATDKAGISLRLYSVQVIELSGGGGDDADGFGVEDGYVGSPSTNTPKPAEPETDDCDEDEDF